VTGQFDLAQLKMSRSLTDQKSKICRDLGWIKKAKKKYRNLGWIKKAQIVAIWDG
jgi:hypothetical protein